DDDAVRIMTIHAAKGLEFPITIVSGLSTQPQHRSAPAEVVFPPTGEPGYKFGKYVTTEEFEAWTPIDEQMSYHERIRLLYVACTRARDHLVVSLTRKDRAKAPEASKRTNAELLVDGMGPDLLTDVPDAAPPLDDDVAAPALPAPAALTPPPPHEDWLAERTAALSRAARPTTVAATALTEEGLADWGEDLLPGSEEEGLTETEDETVAGLQKRPRDLDLPPWLKGRYGTAVGRAVHGVLQTIDLATGAGLDAAVAAQCEAEAIPDRAADVRRLVEAALSSPTAQEAARSPHWREVYVCTPFNGRLLEGYIDLLYRRGDEGLVIVDYKTAASSDPMVLDSRLAGYRPQGASYAIGVAAATGEPVVDAAFLFLTPSGCVDRRLEDLHGVVAEVGRALEASPSTTFPFRAPQE